MAGEWPPFSSVQGNRDGRDAVTSFKILQLLSYFDIIQRHQVQVLHPFDNAVLTYSHWLMDLSISNFESVRFLVYAGTEFDNLGQQAFFRCI